MIEKFLGTLAGDEEATRIQLVQVGEPGEVPTLELRMQRDCGELGWSTQRRMKLAAGQWRELRDALNMMDPDAREARRPAAPSDDARPALRLIG